MKQGWCWWLLRAFALAGLLLAFGGCSGVNTSPRSATGTSSRVVTATRDGGTRSPVAVTPSLTVREVIATAVAKRPADFAFSFMSAACGESVTIDTFTDTFTVFVPQDGRYNAGTRTIPLTLTPDEVRAVYRQMLVIDFFAYPASLSTAGIPQGGRANDYDFRVRRDGHVQTFHWTTTGTRTPTEMERDLSDLTQRLITISYAYPQTQSVPRGAGCT
jgi:hypothetical protein